MKIALIAPVEESIPPKKYGGIEMVIYDLIEEFMRLGHDVTLFAPGDSRVACKLVATVPQSIRTVPPFDSDLKAREVQKYIALTEMMQTLGTESFDIVHNHTGPRFLMLFRFMHQPMVTTLHMPIERAVDQIPLRAYPKTAVISISDRQRLPMPELSYVGTVYNGINTEPYTFNTAPEDYLLFLARFTPDKGAKEALEIAKKTGKKLVVAAKVDTYDQEYFDSCKQLIDGNQITFVGEIGMEEKVKLLSHATALLAPIQWEEPFGLYAVEAMACGTPVIGTARGAFPELIIQGKTGFLGTTTDELAGFVERIDELSRADCRAHVEAHFTRAAMAANYVSMYQKVIASYPKTV